MSNSIKKLIERLKFRQRGSTVEGKLSISLFFPLYLYELRTKAKSSNQNPYFLRSSFFFLNLKKQLFQTLCFSSGFVVPTPYPSDGLK